MNSKLDPIVPRNNSPIKPLLDALWVECGEVLVETGFNDLVELRRNLNGLKNGRQSDGCNYYERNKETCNSYDLRYLIARKDAAVEHVKESEKEAAREVEQAVW